MNGRVVRHAILDRDGVLNRELESGWLSAPSQWEWEEGSLEALELLSRQGLEISIVSNQSGIGRGIVSLDAVEEVHRWLVGELAAVGVELNGIFFCPHAPGDGCDCRKPLPGLVHQAIERSGIPAESSLLIGDDRRDLEAGRAAGVPVALVCTGKGAGIRDHLDPNALVFENLLAAVRFMVAESEGIEGAARNL